MERSPKVVRSYRVVFRRRWRIFHVQGWRIPLPGGLELRAVGYWLCCLGAVALLGALPGVGIAVASLPDSLRLLVLPMFGAWVLASWEVDGRAPHRALLGLAAWRLRPRGSAGLRRCPSVGSEVSGVGTVAMAPDRRGSTYPRGRLSGPARVLLRFPVSVRLQGAPRAGTLRERAALARCWRLRSIGGALLQRGRVLEVPAGRVVIFE